MKLSAASGGGSSAGAELALGSPDAWVGAATGVGAGVGTTAGAGSGGGGVIGECGLTTVVGKCGWTAATGVGALKAAGVDVLVAVTVATGSLVAGTGAATGGGTSGITFAAVMTSTSGKSTVATDCFERSTAFVGFRSVAGFRGGGAAVGGMGAMRGRQ